MNISFINAHNDRITNVIFLSNNNIISCSNNITIKIKKLFNNKFQWLTSIKITSKNFDYDINLLLL